MPSAPHTNESPHQGGWWDEHRYEVLVSTPEVREAVSASAAGARAPMSAEEFLARAFAVLPFVGHQAVHGAAHGNRLGRRLGLRTGRTREEALPRPVGWVTTAVLCSLARHAQPVSAVEQHADGCTLTAEIPSDARTFGGVLTVTVGRGAEGHTTVRARAEIPGQLLDWGRSRQALDTLLADLRCPG
ncbi:hypothetical protein E0L36_24700 [Streptomyces sp. AJS327]|uniref:hypothetical protein n=1 Tax=Streptomyces sp. AJS327 TaxID=2545265 RepID=UPI0015DF6F31|nr:hypothetical protein [Streptomyces sp. AJS327]MBA0053933.1 hypothetical protein [Streptomyces sp. AJS327]